MLREESYKSKSFLKKKHSEWTIICITMGNIVVRAYRKNRWSTLCPWAHCQWFWTGGSPNRLPLGRNKHISPILPMAISGKLQKYWQKAENLQLLVSCLVNKSRTKIDGTTKMVWCNLWHLYIWHCSFHWERWYDWKHWDME